MKLTSYGQRPSRCGRPVSIVLALILVASWPLAGCGTAGAPVAGAVTPSPEPTSTPKLATAAQVEEQYGVEVTLVALTAANGLIDCRFRVVDPAKASFLLQADSMALLIVEKSDMVIQIHEPIDQPALIQGRVYSVVYPNVQNALEPGDQVTILVFGDLRLEHLVVQ
jgi:hypothetical protein